MRFTLRPYIVAGVAIAGAGIIVVTPGAPQLPDIQVPAVQPAGTQVDDFNVQDFLGVLANTGGAVSPPDAAPSPDTEGLDPAAGLPDLGGPLNSAIAPPDLGPLDFGRLDLGGLDLGAVASPGNLPGPTSSDVPAAP